MAGLTIHDYTMTQVFESLRAAVCARGCCVRTESLKLTLSNIGLRQCCDACKAMAILRRRHGSPRSAQLSQRGSLAHHVQVTVARVP